MVFGGITYILRQTKESLIYGGTSYTAVIYITYFSYIEIHVHFTTAVDTLYIVAASHKLQQ